MLKDSSDTFLILHIKNFTANYYKKNYFIASYKHKPII